ncbi:MaoC/PaaZ C-terminal domain-containing protein [Pseudoduganella sp. GCM10020061]|uniref:MaoC/PaaZ C-terminal domain-containing protein n=1 Tax=Pseudoduganella sp. GCM10020061 TaxID=3317345 RepID=UPI00363E234E
MNAITLLRAVLKRGRAVGDALEGFHTAYRFEGLDADNLRRYNALLGFGPNELPLTYYYLIAQRAHVATLLRDAFPFAVAGMVHVENDLIEHQVPALNAPFDITSTVRVEPPTATGARYCVLESVAEHGGTKLFTCRSKYLAKRGRRKGSPAQEDTAGSPAEEIDRWTLSSSTGREYAAVSGDWNPIHLWKWSARLMGMQTPIIHGMHTLAKACAAIEARTGSHVTAVSARFTSPVPLGETASVALAPDGRDFSVVCRDRVAVQGTLGFAPADSPN